MPNLTDPPTELSHRSPSLAGDTLEACDPFCLGREQAIEMLARAPWRRLAVLGDSIAEGIGDDVAGYADISWADRLASLLDEASGGIAYLNVGVRGLLAGEVRSSQLDTVLAFAPDLAVVSAGANDMLRRSFDPTVVAAELDAIVAPLAGAGALVVTFGLLDLSRTSLVPDDERAWLGQRIAALNAVTRRVTARHGGVHVDFFDHPALGDALFSADRIHPNRRGHAYIASDVVRALHART